MGRITHLPGVGMWSLAVAFALCEALPAHFEHRREAISITLTTLPLVVGLFAVSPVTLIVARVGGSALTLVFLRHQKPLKLSANLASFWVQAVITIAVFRTLVHHTAGPVSWPSLFLAVVVGDLCQTILLDLAISIYQRRWEPSIRDTAVVSTVAALVETCLGIVAVSLLVNKPATLLPLSIVIGLVLLSLRTHRALGDRHRELGQLYDFSNAIGNALLDGRVLTTVLAQARDVMHAERAWLYLDDGAGGLLQASITPNGASVERTSIPTSPIHGAALVAGAPLLIRSGDEHHGHLLEVAGVNEMLISPFVGSSGTVGTLVVADRSGDVRGFLPDDARLFATLTNHACVSIENNRLVDNVRDQARRSEHQSLHDGLTGLPNRVLFAKQLESALSDGAPTAVLLLDLDRFKEINDTLGHHYGDLVLQQVGARLRGVLRRGDLVSRLGGDEFAVLLPDIEGEPAAVQVARGVIEMLERPFLIDDISVDVGGSIGIAVSPRDGDDPVTLLQRADVAMYTAKADQTGVEAYRPERDGYSPARLTLVGELRHAIQEGELAVHYQPQIDLTDGSILGVEALVRWNHPTRGMVSPDEFISVAEHTGLIEPLTRFVLDEALASSSRWGQNGQPLRVSVNLSARSLSQSNLAADISALLRRHQVPVGGLCLEVTESSIMTDPRRSAANLEALHALGITISVDDFGMGHSSLAYIKSLPVGEIKIDRSFVSSMIADRSDQAIVRTILALGDNLDIQVVVEGVEDIATRDLLRSMGCTTAQGYLFARPMPAAELEDWLERSQPRRHHVIVPMSSRNNTATIATA